MELYPKLKSSLATERKMRSIMQTTTFRANPPTVLQYQQHRLKMQNMQTNHLRAAYLMGKFGINSNKIKLPCM